MKKHIRFFTLFLSILSFSVTAESAEEISSSFKYETTWRIVYFQGDRQILSGRPDTSYYNPEQGFIRIYDIVIKYVHSMAQSLPAGSVSTPEAWTEIYLINEIGSQKLLVGDHLLGDGKGWAIMDDEDYVKLSGILKSKTRPGDPFDGSKEDAIKALLWQSTDKLLGDYDTQFNRPKKAASKHSQDSPGNISDKSLDTKISDHNHPASSSNKIQSSLHLSDIDSDENLALDKFIEKIKQPESKNNIVPNENKEKNDISFIIKFFLVACIAALLYFRFFRK